MYAARSDVEALAAALRAAHLLEAEQAVMRIWREEGEAEARALLPILFRDLLRRTGAVVRLLSQRSSDGR